VNLLAREQAELLQQLLDLGPALAQAQRAGQGDALRALGQQRRELVAAVTGTAVGFADRALTAQVRTEVEQTLEAALADPRAADAVRSGRLVRPLSYAGFGDVDVDGAVAVRSAMPARTARTLEPASDLAELERTALDAAAALDDAVRACEDAEQRREQAERRQVEASEVASGAAQQVRRLEEQLAKARETEQRAAQDQKAAARGDQEAAADAERRRRAVADAQAAAEQARTALDRARRG
jgi:hypothetical protein